MQFTDNQLVSQLSRREQQILHGACHATVLSANQILSPTRVANRAIYFLAGASVALLARRGSGPRIAVGLVGREGAVGLQFGLGLGEGDLTMMVQTEGAAWLIGGAAMKALLQSRPALLLTVSRYLWASSQELAAFSACVQTQTLTQRLAAWIVKSQGNDIESALMLTQAHLAQMLGVRRASITSAAVELRELGLIDYVRGRLSVVDQAALEAVSLGRR